MQSTNSIGQNFITLKGGQQFEVQQCYCYGKSYAENMNECMSNLDNVHTAGLLNSIGLTITLLFICVSIIGWVKS